MATKLSLRAAKRTISAYEIEIYRLKKMLARKNRQLEVAQVDGLTGLLRREGFEEHVKKELSRSKRTGEPFAVCIVDLNDLKKVNDTYGHPAGDEMIKKFAKVLKKATREWDIVARTGGDEFMILLLAQNLTNALTAKERLLKELEARKKSLRYFFGAAIGFASTDQGHATFQSLYDAADSAMYEHKKELKQMAG